MTCKDVAIEKIRMDGTLQARASMRTEVIEEYAESYRAGVAMPPPVVFHDGRVYWLADGWHRIEAIRIVGSTTVVCEIKYGGKADAIKFACSANQHHGLRRSNEDKQRAIKLAHDHPELKSLSTRELAAYLGVSHQSIKNFRTPAKSGDAPGEAVKVLQPDLQPQAATAVASDPKPPESRSVDTHTESPVKPVEPQKPHGIEVDGKLIEVPEAVAKEAAEVTALVDEARAILKQLEQVTDKIAAVNLDCLRGRVTFLPHGQGRRLSSIVGIKIDLKKIRPHGPCPVCVGVKSKNCDCCFGSGWVPKDMWESPSYSDRATILMKRA